MVVPVQATENGDGPMPEKAEYSTWGSGVDALDGSSSAHQIEEDPEQEFAGGSSCYEPGMPRIINVGIDGPGERTGKGRAHEAGQTWLCTVLWGTFLRHCRARPQIGLHNYSGASN